MLSKVYTKTLKQLFFLLFCLTMLSACRKQAPSNGDIVMAKAFGEELSLSQIQETFPPNLNEQDSILFVRHYIEQWLEKQVLWHAAKKHIKKDYEEELRQYQQSLAIYDYRREFLKEHLDTVVTPSEIEEYYQTHNDNFLLQEDILRCLYIKLPTKNQTEANKIKKVLFRETQPSDQYIQELYYASRGAVNTFFNRNIWLHIRDLLREIPMHENEKTSSLKTNRYIEIKDKNFIYLIRILEYKPKDSLSPLALEQDNIRQAILNKRKQDILKDLRSELFKEAEQSNNIYRIL